MGVKSKISKGRISNSDFLSSISKCSVCVGLNRLPHLYVCVYSSYRFLLPNFYSSLTWYTPISRIRPNPPRNVSFSVFPLSIHIPGVVHRREARRHRSVSQRRDRGAPPSGAFESLRRTPGAHGDQVQGVHGGVHRPRVLGQVRRRVVCWLMVLFTN